MYGWVLKRPQVPILALFFGFLLYWFRFYFSALSIPSVDLPGHINIIENFRKVIFEGRLVFYDPSAFTGWPVLVFDGPIPYILGALLSFALDPISSESARLATHLIMAFGCALIPLSFWYALRPLAHEMLSEMQDQSLREGLIALASVVFSFWFINHDEQWFGIGAAAITNIGLYAQLYGVHALLLFIGALLRVIVRSDARLDLKLSLALLLLLLSHLFSSVFAIFLAGLCWLWFPASRSAIFKSLIFGFGLAAFWFLPFLYFLPNFAPLDIIRPEHDFFKLLFRYPWNSILKSLSNWRYLQIDRLDPIHLFAPLLLLSICFLEPLRRKKLNMALLAMGFAAILFFSSGFVASSLPLGLHYYRFLAFIFLLFSLLLTSLSLHFMTYSKFSRWATGAILCASLLTLVCLPHEELEKVKFNSSPLSLRDQNQVIEYFKAQPFKGRVYVEYLSDYEKFPWLSAHYITSRIFKESGFEAIVHVFIQRTIAYRMLVAGMHFMNAKAWHTALLFTDHAQWDYDSIIAQFKSFGLTHIVAATARFVDALKPYAIEPMVKIGPYTVVQIAKAPMPQVEGLNKIPLGYLDLKGNLPFQLVEYYFYARKELWSKFELIDLTHQASLPKMIEYSLVNIEGGSRGTQTLNSMLNFSKIIRLNYTRHFNLDHYHVDYPRNFELDQYNELERYLTNWLKLPELLSRYAELGDLRRNETAVPKLLPKLSWAADWQSLQLSNLEAGKLYRINYSYFPYWWSGDGVILRGMQERIFFVPNSSEAALRFDASTHWIVIVGYLISLIFGLLALWQGRIALE